MKSKILGMGLLLMIFSGCYVIDMFSSFFRPNINININAPVQDNTQPQPQVSPQQTEQNEQLQQNEPSPSFMSGFGFMPNVIFFDTFEDYKENQKLPFNQWTGNGYVYKTSEYDSTYGFVLKIDGKAFLNVNIFNFLIGGYYKLEKNTAAKFYFHTDEKLQKGFYVEIPYQSGQQINVYKFDGSSKTKVASAPVPFYANPDGWRFFAILYQDGTIQIFYENGLILEYQDSKNDLKSGIFAFEGKNLLIDEIGIGKIGE